jgi:hypothetical protein
MTGCLRVLCGSIAGFKRYHMLYLKVIDDNEKI